MSSIPKVFDKDRYKIYYYTLHSFLISSNPGAIETVLSNSFRSYEVAINKGGKFESKIDWSGQRPICREPTEILNVFDMNGDGKSDLVCGDKSNAFKELLLHIED